MSLQFVDIAGLALFAATVIMITLHVGEWLQIAALVRLRTDDGPTIQNVSSKSLFLKRALEVETIYYLVMLGFLLLFMSKVIILSAFVVLFVISHFVEFHALEDKAGEKLLSELTRQRVAALFAFDVVEFVLLVFLGMRLYPFVSGAI